MSDHSVRLQTSLCNQIQASKHTMRDSYDRLRTELPSAPCYVFHPNPHATSNPGLTAGISIPDSSLAQSPAMGLVISADVELNAQLLSTHAPLTNFATLTVSTTETPHVGGPESFVTSPPTSSAILDTTSDQNALDFLLGAYNAAYRRTVDVTSSSKPQLAHQSVIWESLTRPMTIANIATCLNLQHSVFTVGSDGSPTQAQPSTSDHLFAAFFAFIEVASTVTPKKTLAWTVDILESIILAGRSTCLKLDTRTRIHALKRKRADAVDQLEIVRPRKMLQIGWLVFVLPLDPIVYACPQKKSLRKGKQRSTNDRSPTRRMVSTFNVRGKQAVLGVKQPAGQATTASVMSNSSQGVHGKENHRGSRRRPRADQGQGSFNSAGSLGEFSDPIPGPSGAGGTTRVVSFGDATTYKSEIPISRRNDSSKLYLY